jgi:hypothetical protein
MMVYNIGDAGTFGTTSGSAAIATPSLAHALCCVSHSHAE